MSFARGEATLEFKGPFGRRVGVVAGGRGMVADVDEFLRRLAEIDRKRNTTSQAFDASQVAGAEHLVHAARLALIAHATKHNFASSLNIELVCWVAAERQIGRAFRKVGVQRGEGELAFLTIGTSRPQLKAAMNEIFRELGIKRDDSVLELKRGKLSAIKKNFSISQKELRIAPLRKIVLERVALLALAR